MIKTSKIKSNLVTATFLLTLILFGKINPTFFVVPNTLFIMTIIFTTWNFSLYIVNDNYDNNYGWYFFMLLVEFSLVIHFNISLKTLLFANIFFLTYFTISLKIINNLSN